MHAGDGPEEFGIRRDVICPSRKQSERGEGAEASLIRTQIVIRKERTPTLLGGRKRKRYAALLSSSWLSSPASTKAAPMRAISSRESFTRAGARRRELAHQHPGCLKAAVRRHAVDDRQLAADLGARDFEHALLLVETARCDLGRMRR
jgi:hypothetical protein